MVKSHTTAIERAIAAHRDGSLAQAEAEYREILRVEGSHPDAAHNLAVILASSGKFGEAGPLFAVAWSIRPDIEQFWLSYIETLIHDNKLATAFQRLNELRKSGCSNSTEILASKLNSKLRLANDQRTSPPAAQLQKLLNSFNEGNNAEAAKLAHRTIKEYPKHSFAWQVLSKIHARKGKVSDALQASIKAVATSPSDPQAHNVMGGLLLKINRHEEAILCFEEAIELRSDFLNAHCNRGSAYKASGNLAKAMSAYCDALAIKSDFAPAHYNLACCKQELGDIVEAEVHYRAATDVDQNHTRAFENLGGLLQEQGRFDEALLCFDKCIELDRVNAKAYFNRGNLQRSAGRVDAALEDYARSIAIEPKNAQVLHNQGVALQQQLQFALAAESYRAALSLEPHNHEILNCLGTALHELKQFEEALEQYQKALSISPDFVEAMLNKGFTLTVAKKFEAAEETYKRAIECSQNIEEPFDRLMKLWRARGKFKEVKDWCEQSLDYATAYISLALAKNALGDLEGAIETINIGSTRQDASEKKEYALLQGVLNALKSDSQCARTQTTKSKKNKPFEFLQYQRPVNPDLIAALHRVESRKLDLAPNSPVYGNGTCSVDYNFFKDAKHPAIQSMVQDLSEIMRQAVGSEILIFDSFFNFFDSGSGIPRHNHLGELDLEGPLNLRDQKYSLVYYLSVGSQDTTQPGQLLLHDPDEIIIPETGMVGIFPAGWSHSASYDGRSRRILVGANFYQL